MPEDKPQLAKSSLSADARMRFFRAGGMDQLCIENADDLHLIRSLDQKLWVALSCPTGGLEFDVRTLEFIDTNKDARIRCREMIDAVEWALHMLKTPDSLTAGSAVVPLDAIDDSHPEGTKLLQSARRILRNLGKDEATEISLEDSQNRERIFAAAKYNGDGIIPPTAAKDPEVQQVIRDILATVGGQADRGGKDGVTAEGVELFFKSLEGYRNWRQQSEHDAEKVLPYGEDTAKAFTALMQIEDKVEDFFAQCKLAAFDSRAEKPLNIPEGDLSDLKAKDRFALAETLKNYPLAYVRADAELPLRSGVNPAFADAVTRFDNEVVARVFGEAKETLSHDEWLSIQGVFASYREWQKSQVGGAVEKLGMERITAILESDWKEDIQRLIAADQAIAAEIEAIAQVEKLVRYHRDLFRLLNNFVSFPEFYNLNKKAIFQAGTLYMDGRNFHLCVTVGDVAKHSAIAQQAGIYLLYCELRSHRTNEKKTIAAAVTAGNANRLAVGKNGIFYDRKGDDWDATVVKIVSHPISLREAIWAPFKRLGQLISSQFEKISSSREKALQSEVEKGVTDVTKSVDAGPEQAAKSGNGQQSNSGMGGMLAGGGVAIAALSSSFAFISSTLASVNKVYFFYTAVIFLMFILLPSLIIGILKLRKRDMSLILEACGWAINGPMRLNFALARIFTRLSVLPEGASRVHAAEVTGDKTVVRWWVWTLLVVAVAAAIVCGSWS